MKIKSIKSVGKRPVYDISVQDNHQYALENGIISHNTGSYYGADNIWILGRQQDKDGKEIQGYHFIINIEKSRFVREKSKIPITVSYDGGINKWSGLFDIALEAGYIIQAKKGWYTLAGSEELIKEANIIDNSEIWTKIFNETDFKKHLENKYSLEKSE